PADRRRLRGRRPVRARLRALRDVRRGRPGHRGHRTPLAVRRERAMTGKTGVWLVGGRGSVATTATLGAAAVRGGLSARLVYDLGRFDTRSYEAGALGALGAFGIFFMDAVGIVEHRRAAQYDLLRTWATRWGT